MPTYDYECDACGHKLEHFQSMSSAVLKKCPKCGKSKLRRLIGTGAGVIFKGSGFYATDYRGDSYHQAAKKDSAPSADTSTASKPAGASETSASSDTASQSKPTETPTAGKSESKPAGKHAGKQKHKE